MYKVVSYKDKPAVIISQSKEDLPTFTATVMYFVEEDNMVQARTETIYDKTLLSEYDCPFADTAFPHPSRMYCMYGKCKYSLESPARLSFMCASCLATSIVFDDVQR
jgi:hypothetical protein